MSSWLEFNVGLECSFEKSFVVAARNRNKLLSPHVLLLFYGSLFVLLTDLWVTLNLTQFPLVHKNTCKVVSLCSISHHSSLPNFLEIVRITELLNVSNFVRELQNLMTHLWNSKQNQFCEETPTSPWTFHSSSSQLRFIITIPRRLIAGAEALSSREYQIE